MQTQKVRRFPIVLVGKRYWSGLHGWLVDTVLECRCIDAADLDLFRLVDTVDEAAEVIIEYIKERE